MTSSKPNFLTSKIGKFSLGRNCLTPRLPLLFCFLNLLEYTMSRTQSQLNHFSFFPITPHFSSFLFPFRSSLYYTDFPFPTTFHHFPSFLFPPHLTDPTNCLPFKFPYVGSRSLRKSTAKLRGKDLVP